MRRTVLLGLFWWGCVVLGAAQISPPGLGNTKIAGWAAIGLRQSLDSAAHKQLVTYFGVGRKSNPDNYDPYQKAAILVLNAEFYHQFHPRWQYSAALSYRRQNQYAGTAPFLELNPGIQQEFRLYGRFSNIIKTKRLKWVNTFRQEFRKYYTPDFQEPDEILQFRSRLRSQLTINLDRAQVHRLVGSAEALFSISKENQTQHPWTAWGYRESRLCLYYSFAPLKSSFVFNLGYMDNVLGTSSLKHVHYLALDVIWENPLQSLRHIRKKTAGFME